MKTLYLNAAASALFGLSALTSPALAQTADPAMTPATVHAMHVAKSPTCGCCGAWVALARAEGYDVTVTDMPDVKIAKIEAAVPQKLWSCHTAEVDGYVIEGHVPFDAIAKLLQERPAIAGLSVPGMPMGSPGMGDDPTARYDVMAFGGTATPNEVFFEAGR